MTLWKLFLLMTFCGVISAQTIVPDNSTFGYGFPNMTDATTTIRATTTTTRILTTTTNNPTTTTTRITTTATTNGVVTTTMPPTNNPTSTTTRTTTAVSTNGVVTTTMPPSPPPALPSTMANSISSFPPLVLVDTEVQLVFKQLLPNIPIDQVPIISANKSNLFNLFDSIPASSWAMQPQIADAYSKYLERLFLGKLEKEATLSRIQNLFPFRQDCNLGPIISAANLTGPTRDSFINTALMRLPVSVSNQLCGSLVSLSSSFNQPLTVANLQNTINSGIPIGAFYQQNQLNALPPADKLNVLNSLASAPSPPKLDRQTAQSLGQNIPKNATIANVASVLSAVPIEILNNAPSSQIVAVFNKFDVDNMDQSRINFVANKIASSGTASDVLNVLSNGNQKLSESIPYKRILELNITTDSIPLVNLPQPLILNDAKSLLDTKTVDQVSDARSLVKICQAITPTDIKKVPHHSEIKTAAALLNASNSDSSPNPLTKTQRTGLLDSVLNYLIRLSGSSSPSTYLSYLSNVNASNLAELFVEANDTILAPLSNLNVFSTIITSLSKIPSTRCNSFLKRGAALYTSYAVKNLKGSSTISASHLDSLGVCFANNIPSSDLNDLSTSDLVSKISYFSGDNFQPDQQTATIFGAKITAAISSKTTQSDKEDLIFNQLQDTAIFATNLDQGISSSTWLTKGKSLLSQATDSKEVKSETVKLNRLGVSGDSYISGLLQNAKTLYVNAYKGAAVSGRKRRAITSLTCQNLYDLSGALDAVSASDLSTMSQGEFSTCLTFFNTYSWSSVQAAALAPIAKAYYSNNVASIPDSDIAYLSTILPAFSTSELQSLKITSLNTISELGQVNTWSNDQLTSLVTAIKSNYGPVDSNALNQMKNLACGLSQSDWNSFSYSTLTNALPTLKTIDNQDCAQITNIFSKFLSYMGTGTFNITNLVDLGVIAGGFDASALSFITPDQLSFIDLSYIPASTVNSLPLYYFRSLTTSQISELINSPYASLFNKDVTNTLTSLSTNQPVQTTSSTSRITLNLFGLLISVFISIYFIDFKFL